MPDLSPLLQTVIGGLMTMGGGALAHRLTLGREREARQHEAEERRRRQQADFQIKTLSDLQDALCRVMKAVYTLADFDYNYTFSGVERDRKKSGRIWRVWQDAYATSMVCAARARDAEIRQAVGDILQMALSLATPLKRQGSDLDQARENAEDMREKLMETFERVNQCFGDRLRALY
jgi:hypothetical protein